MEHRWRPSFQISNTISFRRLVLVRHFQISNSISVNGSLRSPVCLTFTPTYSGQLPPALASPRFQFHHKKTPSFLQDSSRLNSKFRVRVSGKDREGLSWPSGNNAKVVIFSSVATLVLSVANRVLYKLALVPMKEYPFFLAQVTTFGYVAIYFFILYTRYKVGSVTDEMLALPKTRFMIIGFLEALGVVAGMSAGAMLPGPTIPILNQTFLVWQLAFSVLLLGRSYSLNKIVGCLLVAAGVILSVTSGSDSSLMVTGIGLSWPALMILSTAFQAGASIIKESLFLDAASRLKGRSLDIFVVNSFGSGFQALFVLLLLPFLSSLKGIPFSQLPSYLKSGAGCFLNAGTNVLGCEGAPLLPLVYILTNICFNISVLKLVKNLSAVVSTLVVTSSVPIIIYVLSLPLPYLPEGVPLAPLFLLGSAIVVTGLILYNATPLKKKPEME